MTANGFPEHIDRINIVIPETVFGPRCPVCKKGPTYKRAFFAETPARIEWHCAECGNSFAIVPPKRASDVDGLNPIPLCQFCHKPVTEVFEEYSETTTETFELNSDGKFEYQDGDVDNDDPVEITHECGEYPGDPACDWYNDNKSNSMESKGN